MAKKGKAKNGINKAKHTRLMNQKKSKLKNKKESNLQRMRALKNRIKEQANLEEEQYCYCNKSKRIKEHLIV